jgi:hypothetical protein
MSREDCRCEVDFERRIAVVLCEVEDPWVDAEKLRNEATRTGKRVRNVPLSTKKIGSIFLRSWNPSRIDVARPPDQMDDETCRFGSTSDSRATKRPSD